MGIRGIWQAWRRAKHTSMFNAIITEYISCPFAMNFAAPCIFKAETQPDSKHMLYVVLCAFICWYYAAAAGSFLARGTMRCTLAAS